MKNIKYAAAAIALTALSFGAFAAEPVTPAQAESMNKIGVVSAQKLQPRYDGLKEISC